MPDKDPIATAARRSKASRKIAQRAGCSYCDETSPAALIPGAVPAICTECQREARGKSRFDQHHVAGQNNHGFTVPVPANIHKKLLNELQHEWPKKTLQNPDRSPLLAAAACVQGFIDTIHAMIDNILAWIPAFLEWLDAILTTTHGPK